jgi:hypothetical protein
MGLESGSLKKPTPLEIVGFGRLEKIGSDTGSFLFAGRTGGRTESLICFLSACRYLMAFMFAILATTESALIHLIYGLERKNKMLKT